MLFIRDLPSSKLNTAAATSGWGGGGGRVGNLTALTIIIQLNIYLAFSGKNI